MANPTRAHRTPQSLALARARPELSLVHGRPDVQRARAFIRIADQVLESLGRCPMPSPTDAEAVQQLLDLIDQQRRIECSLLVATERFGSG